MGKKQSLTKLSVFKEKIYFYLKMFLRDKGFFSKFEVEANGPSRSG